MMAKRKTSLKDLLALPRGRTARPPMDRVAIRVSLQRLPNGSWQTRLSGIVIGFSGDSPKSVMGSIGSWAIGANVKAWGFLDMTVEEEELPFRLEGGEDD